GSEHGRTKCHQYWPDRIGKQTAYGDIGIVWEAEAVHPDDPSVVSRRLRLTKSGVRASVVVTHLQYLGWPDHGVPENPLGVLRLRQLAHRMQTEGEAEARARIPMVVHCSAGCGRTGAFCAIDTLLALAETKAKAQVVDADGDVSMGGVSGTEKGEDRWVDEPPSHLHGNLVFMVVARFREQRMTSVQTGGQFAFCHETLAWVLLGAGPRPLERAIDRRLVAEWNRVNHPQLSPAACADITYLMRGRCEMVNAMQQQQSAAAAAASAASAGDEAGDDVLSSRASVDIGGSPAVVMPPMVKRSNTLGATKRGLF
ncbi:hypothetical protein IWW38_006566, partial [Coemansia aciculifera]